VAGASYRRSVEPATPPVEALSLYGRVSGESLLSWPWVESQLVTAGTYWVTARETGYPHPRPVWGVWSAGSLYLSIGSPTLAHAIEVAPEITVHPDSGTDVVIVEGVAGVLTEPHADVIARYDAKYEWRYVVEEYGPMTRVDPVTIVAWRSAGWAGREGFREVGRWRFA
jgi:hypothetical protein